MKVFQYIFVFSDQGKNSTNFVKEINFNKKIKELCKIEVNIKGSKKLKNAFFEIFLCDFKDTLFLVLFSSFSIHFDFNYTLISRQLIQTMIQQ